MSEKINFTMTRLRNIQPCKKKRKYIYDKVQPGLRLAVTSNGVKSFQFQIWSKKKNAPLTRTIGKFGLISISEARMRFEKKYIIKLLKKNSGNVAKTAKDAGKYRADFYNLMKKYDIDPDEFRG